MTQTFTLQAGHLSESGNVLTPEHFGIIQTGFGNFNDFRAQFNYLSGGSVRWPGGTLSEQQTNVYGLDIPGLFDGTQLWSPDPGRIRPTLTEMMDFAVTNGVALSVQIPTARYLNNPDLGKQQLGQFLDDLASGKYGQIPAILKLEIGNEFYALPEFSQNPAAYGALANEFLNVINNSPALHNNPQLANALEAGVQMGRTLAEDSAIRGAISNSNLSQIDFLIAHQLPYRFEAVDKPSHLLEDGTLVSRTELIRHQVDIWNSLISNGSPNGRHIGYELTGWTVGEANPSANVNLQYQDYGARQASASLELFVTNIDNGAEGANLWGVGVNNSNNFATSSGGAISYSFGGEIFKLMSENLIGKQIISGFEDFDRQDPFTLFSFRDLYSVDIFVAANDIPDTGYDFQLMLERYGTGFSMSVDRIGVSYPTGGNLDPTDPSARLFETPVISSWVGVSNSGTIDVSLTQDFEILHFSLTLLDPTTAVANFFGFNGVNSISVSGNGGQIHAVSGTNQILGGGGNDTLTGGVGSDYLSGAAGNDVLVGDISNLYFANDVLDPGAGDDFLMGGGGSDNFVFKPNYGTNVIADISFDPATGAFSGVSGRDFDPRLDKVSLLDFGYSEVSDVQSFIHDNASGSATFSDQGTTIEFFGITTQELLNADFFIL